MFQACNVGLVALQIKVTALLAGWEWAAITAVDTEPPMAWADTVSKVLLGDSVNVSCDRRQGWWALGWEKGKEQWFFGTESLGALHTVLLQQMLVKSSSAAVLLV